MKEIAIDKESLKQLYLKQGLKQAEIAEIYNCSVPCISKKLDKYHLRKNTKDSYIGRKFGLLTPIDISGKDKNSHLIFVCVCDCGKQINVLGHSLKTGNTKTCGCESRKRGKDHHLYKGYEEISSSMWSSITHHAKTRKIDVKITIEEAWDKFIIQGRRCILSGEILIFAKTRKSYNTTTASLDRIDSQGIYEISNTQWVHKRLNVMKMDLSQEDFINWCKKVSRYN